MGYRYMCACNEICSAGDIDRHAVEKESVERRIELLVS